MLLHNISTGIQNAGALPDEKKAKELRTFLNNTTDLNLGENAEEIMRDAKRGVLFCEEAALSETDCGTFWTELLSTRPVEDYYNRVDPDGLFDLFSELSSAYAYFGGKKDEEMGEAQDYQNALEEAYHTHWQNKVLLHPDAERAERLLAQGEFPDYEDICREILLVEYPEEVPHETAEDFGELSWNDILNDVFASNTAKGIQMWRRLLDIAEPSLKTNAIPSFPGTGHSLFAESVLFCKEAGTGSRKAGTEPQAGTLRFRREDGRAHTEVPAAVPGGAGNTVSLAE